MDYTSSVIQPYTGLLHTWLHPTLDYSTQHQLLPQSRLLWQQGVAKATVIRVAIEEGWMDGFMDGEIIRINYCSKVKYHNFANSAWFMVVSVINK